MDQAIVIVPGIGNSGPDHWQSHWETAFPGAARIAPASWDAPDLADWTAALDSAIANAGAPPFVIGHSPLIQVPYMRNEFPGVVGRQSTGQ